MLSLLVMLHDCAAATTVGSGNIFDAGALKVVLLANHLTLHGNGDTETADAGGTEENKTLLLQLVLLCSYCKVLNSRWC